MDIIAFKTDDNNTQQSPTAYYKTQNHHEIQNQSPKLTFFLM